jgi:hypothetical protein
MATALAGTGLFQGCVLERPFQIVPPHHHLLSISLMNDLPYLLGGWLLVVFGLSCFLASASSHAPALGLSNSVFPFISNDTIFAFAGLLQITLATQVFRYRHTARADVLLIAIGSLLVWYRVARWLLGDTQACGCAGLLREYLNMSAQQERIYSTIGVVTLLVCALPGGWRLLKNRRPGWNAGRGLLGSWAMLLGAMSFIATAKTLSASQDLRLWGRMTEERLNGFGQPHTNLTQRYLWMIEISSEGTWVVSSTNSGNGWRETIAFDGTDTYIIQPSALENSQGSSLRSEPDRNLNLATVSRGPLPLLVSDDVGQVSALWTCFCSLEAKRILGSNREEIVWPILGWSPRSTLKAWGFRWTFLGGSNLAAGGRYLVSDIEMKRDRDLDAKTFDEALTIPEFQYPMDISDRNAAEVSWAALKAYDNGALGGKLEFKEWTTEGGNPIPKRAELSYWLPGRKPSKYHRILIDLDRVELTQFKPHAPPPFLVSTRVDDYRYQQKGEQKHFTAATYLAGVGETWKTSEDSSLKAQQSAWRDRGPKNFTGMFRPIHAILLLGLFPIAFFLVQLWKNVARSQRLPTRINKL